MAIKLGMIGAGTISDIHLKALTANKRVDVICIADPSVKARQSQAARYSIKNTVADYRQILDDPEVEAVDIAVPHFLHYPIAIDALKAGKDVICEKPIAVSIEQANEMIETAETYERKLFVKNYQRFAEHHQRAKEIISDGEIGKPYLSICKFVTQQLCVMNDPTNWRGTWAKAGGGVLIDSGIHLVNLMQFFLGRASAVTATAKRLLAQCADKADDTSLLIIEYENGGIGSIACSNCDTSLGGMTWTKEIYGTDGSLHIFEENGAEKLIKMVNSNPFEVMSVSNWWEFANISAINHLIDCLIGNRQPMNTAEDARHDLEIVLAAYRSSAEGRRIALDR